VKKLTHTDEHGRAKMVDVGDKPDTQRVARARGCITMLASTLDAIRQNTIAKGDVIATARLAGIMAAKKTADLIPLCHTLVLSHVDVDITLDESLPGVRVESEVHCFGRTGVEMEALVAVSTALLTVYDMAKAVDRRMVISDTYLVAKSGGKSGDWQR
jgi:cyclic pyranopterin phosphate synthase